MPRSMLVLAMLAMSAGFVAWAWAAASKVTAGRDDANERRMALVSAAWIMVLILLANAAGFVSTVQTLHQMELNIASDTIHPDGTAVAGPTRADLLFDQLSLLVGTGALMALVIAAIRDPRAAGCPAELAGPTVLMVMVERMLPRFWIAALGLGLVFGIFAPGVALLLAIELTLAYIVGRVLLAAKKAKAPDST